MATQLNVDDLGKLMKLLNHLAGFWKAIADQLGMTKEAVNIERNHRNIGPADFLRDLLGRWLNQETPSPTLEVLCQALRADTEILGGGNAAKELEKEFTSRRGSGNGSGSTHPAPPPGARIVSDSDDPPLQPAPSTTRTKVPSVEQISRAATDIDPTDSDPFAVTKWELKGFHNEFKGKNTVIAIIDSGIYRNHKAFKIEGIKDKIHPDSKNFLGPQAEDDITDDDGHGTHSAGIAAGFPIKDQFPGGVAPEAQLLVCRVCVEKDKPQTMIKALQYLVSLREKGKQIDVVSVSLGYQLDGEQEEEVNKTVNSLVGHHKTILVAAACNNGQESDPIWYPAKCGSAISIGAHDHNKNRAAFSPVGQRLDFLAPGVKIWSPTTHKDWTNVLSQTDGTSCAAPAVAGLIALLIQCAREVGEPASTRISSRTVIMYLLQQMSSHQYNSEYGYGALNPNRLLKTLKRKTAADVLHGHIIEALHDKCDCVECQQMRTK